MVKSLTLNTRLLSSARLKLRCAVMTGASFTALTCICSAKDDDVAWPSLTVTGTVSTPLKFAAGVIVKPDTL